MEGFQAVNEEWKKEPERIDLCWNAVDERNPDWALLSSLIEPEEQQQLYQKIKDRQLVESVQSWFSSLGSLVPADSNSDFERVIRNL